MIVDVFKSLEEVEEEDDEETADVEARVVGGASLRTFSTTTGPDGVISFGLSLRLLGKASLPSDFVVVVVEDIVISSA